MSEHQKVEELVNIANALRDVATGLSLVWSAVLGGSDEERRIKRWYATYNAALTGAHTSNLYSTAGCHGQAADAANCAHGPLEKKE